MSASAVMCIAFLKLQHCASFFRFVHLASLHCLIKVNKVSVELWSVNACKFNLISNLKTAGTTHTFQKNEVAQVRLHVEF